MYRAFVYSEMASSNRPSALRYVPKLMCLWGDRAMKRRQLQTAVTAIRYVGQTGAKGVFRVGDPTYRKSGVTTYAAYTAIMAHATLANSGPMLSGKIIIVKRSATTI